MNGIFSVFFVVMMLATFGFFLLSRRPSPVDSPHLLGPDAPFVVFVLPCLNEAEVIGRSIERLVAISPGDFAVLAIDDGSEDQTAEIVRGYQQQADNIWLLQRTLPNARQGKGVALNHAYRHLRDSGLLGDRPHDQVIVAIIDADGRVQADALAHVCPAFADPAVGAAQIGVRMTNADAGQLPRLQDMEFVIFLDIFQRGRMQLGSVGLGGNGQFVRLSALESLGEEPWSDCLTEDLDLGIRLLIGGWRNVFCHTTHVAQQGLAKFGLLVRQRTRWFQGHLQCWKLLPEILRSNLPTRTVVDLSLNLLGPILVLATSIMSAVFLVAMTIAVALRPQAVGALLTADHGMLLLAGYVLTFGMAPVFAWVYRRYEPGVSRREALALGHLYCSYGYIWYLAGWKAVVRLISGRSGWVKTQRIAESSPSTSPELVV
jgi:1,2-diacylglycerol 3-beta-glucosyltransferase